MSAWAADVALKENFRVAPTGSTAAVSNKDWQGDLCTWHSTSVARRAGDTINTATVKQATWLVLNSRVGEKIYTTNWEGGVKKLSFKFARYGKENTNGRVLKIKASVGTTEYESDGYAKSTLPSANVAAIVSPATTTGHVAYSYDFQHKANDQLTIENASTCSDAEAATNGICRILVSDIEITPYILYRNKDVTVGLKQRGYVNNGSQDFINNTGGEGSIAFSSSNENVATVDPETGVVTPVGVGDAIITATWSEGASTTYTLHVVDGIIAENFSKVVQTGQTTGATWHGDLFDWEVANVRRGADDTLGLSPRIQATAMRSKDGSTIISANPIEGGVKHLAFDWRQWASGTSPLTFKAYYSADKENWGDAVASQSEDAVKASEPHVFDADIDNGANGNAYLKLNYTSTKGVAVLGALKITPWLLYTTKEATLDTRNGLTYTNNDLINNTTGDAPTYEIAPVEGVSINAATGEVTATDDTEGDFTVTATWGAVTTSYTLTVVSRTATTASFANAKVALNLGAEVPANELTKTAGYDGVIAYASSNTAVATVANDGTVTLAGGVGQTTITATLPQTDNYKAAEASYILQVTDNSANVQVEAFSAVPQGNAAAHAGQPWDGDVYDWKVSDCGGVRKNGDEFASDQTREGIWMGTPDPNTCYGSLTVENGVEGGIKHLWFYCEQPYNTGEVGYTLKPVVYLNEATAANKVGEVEIVGTSGAGNIAANRTLFGASNVTKSNSVLIIRNESYLTDGGTRPGSNRGRILLDEIHITPYLLYTTKDAELDLRIATTYINADLINNTESGNIVYSLDDNEGEASIDEESGEVTGIKAGQVTVKATWSEGAYTTYTLNIIDITETEASYPQAEIHATMGEAIPANVLNVTDGYDGEISYASSVPAVADFENGVLTLKAPGQTKITATLPETSNYTEATASYILTVSYANYESFNPNVTTSTYAKPEENAQGDMCKWYVYIGGIQTPNYFSSNAITTRAQRTNESKQGYAKSAKLSGGISALAFNYSMMYADNNIDKWDIHVYVNDRLVGQLTNEEGGDLEGINGRTLNPMRTKVITGINEPGNFVIRFENHSTIKDGVEYESGNMGRFAIDNVSWENYDGAIVLDENADNNSVIAVNSGATVDVELTRSALVGGVWNTLCLPFALPVSTLGVVENGVQQLTSAELNGDELTVGFTAFTGENLVAGTPYLVKPASDLDISGTYYDKQITSIASAVSYSIITMQGIFSPYAMTAGDRNTLFVGMPNDAGDNLFYPSVNGNLKGFRAYFTLNLGSNPAPKRARFVVNQTEIATDIEEISGDRKEISGKFIENGQLIIIRDGKKYNAMGQIIR